MAALCTLSDEEILDLLSQDSRPAFNELYTRYWRSLYQMAWNVLRDRDTSMEVIQDVFLWIWEHRLSLNIQHPPAYLRGAVRYKIIDILRSNKARESCFTGLDDLEASLLPINDDPLELKELKAVIIQLSATLPDRARLIFELSRNEQLSNREIAEKLGISGKTVENQITIALKKLRQAMGNISMWFFFIL
jgi:RNA polymerase sigma-70 factor (ECF subfamily)